MGRAAEDSGACGAGANDRPARAAPRSLGGCGGGAPPSKSKALPPGFEPPGGSPGPPTRAMKEVDGREGGSAGEGNKKKRAEISGGAPHVHGLWAARAPRTGSVLDKVWLEVQKHHRAWQGLGSGREWEARAWGEAKRGEQEERRRASTLTSGFVVCLCAGGVPTRASVGGVGGGGRGAFSGCAGGQAVVRGQPAVAERIAPWGGGGACKRGREEWGHMLCAFFATSQPHALSPLYSLGPAPPFFLRRLGRPRPPAAPHHLSPVSRWVR